MIDNEYDNFTFIFLGYASEDFKARIREMSDTNLILVLKKQLFKTDIRKVENQLSILENQIRKEFLTKEEEEILRTGEGMKVVLIQVRGTIRVNGSCSCRVNVRIVSTFVNPNPTRIINVSTFANPNPTHLLFVLVRSA